MFMSSMKSRKMNLFVIRVLVGITGVLMFSFQNCSRVDTMQVSDIAGKLVQTNELGGSNNQDDQVNVQIEQENGTILAVDEVGNETVVNQPVVQQPAEQQPVQQQPVVQQPVDDQPILVTEDDGVDEANDLDVCESFKEKKHGSLFAVMQKIKCKKKDRKHDGPRCMDLIREHGVTVIDLAKLDDVSSIKSIKGHTVILTSDAAKSAAKTLIIENAVGKTILCGISIARLDIKKGNLQLREGAKIKSCGEIKGRIYKDDQSSIDGSID